MIVSAIEYQGIKSLQLHSEKLQNKQNAPMVKRLSVHFAFGGDCLTGMPYLDGKSGSVGVMLFEKYDNLWEI